MITLLPLRLPLPQSTNYPPDHLLPHSPLPLSNPPPSPIYSPNLHLSHPATAFHAWPPPSPSHPPCRRLPPPAHPTPCAPGPPHAVCHTHNCHGTAPTPSTAPEACTALAMMMMMILMIPPTTTCRPSTLSALPQLLPNVLCYSS